MPDLWLNEVLAGYKEYLEALTSLQIGPRLRSKFGRSDIIQQTLAEALQDAARLRAMEEPACRAVLRQMLLNNLRDEIDRWRAQCRDVDREQRLVAEAEQSSCRVGEWLAGESLSPLEKLVGQERRLRLVEALAELPPLQREAVVLQRIHGWKLHEIADHLGISVGAVSGHQARGLKALRTLLPEME
jgi:RNA polymerase sigma-70 factor (subfamily 1)